MFTLRDFCEPGDVYVDFVTGTRETIPEPTYKVVRHADRGTGTQVYGTGLTSEEAEAEVERLQSYHKNDPWAGRYTIELDTAPTA